MNNIKLFENKKVRSIWNESDQKWYFSIVDVVDVLTDSPNARKYWSVLKTRLKKEDSELTTICSQLKMQSSDGKFYNTDVANAEGLFRIIQSVPSPKAEPFKRWGGKEDNNEVPVSEELFYRVLKNDKVNISLRKGLFNIPWFLVNESKKQSSSNKLIN